MKNICVITGSRAEFGLLTPLLKRIQIDKKMNLKLVVTGSHLQKKYGNTKKEISEENIKISKKINVFPKLNNIYSTLESISIGLKKFNIFFKESKIDLLLILGDRYEILAPAISATFYKIPIAHISGGDCTLGAIDDTVRHCLTKMAWLHFVSNSNSRKRVIQMGENPKRVFNVGNIGAERIKKIQSLSKKDIEQKLKIKFMKKNILVTFHPVTFDDNSSSRHLNEILKALKKLTNTSIIFTYPNNDIESYNIIKIIENFVKKRKNYYVFKSLGFINYVSLLKQVDCVIGNSSSGLLEAPSLKIGTINIGDRQEGRLKAISVLDCKPNKNDILKVINKIYSKQYKEIIKKTKNPYYKSNTTNIIYEKIKKFKKPTVLKKEFFNIKNYY
jgi:GDP/UDP-N,N'-diacetylbacillosamine 2-epimerase (hydrolysing)